MGGDLRRAKAVRRRYMYGVMPSRRTFEADAFVEDNRCCARREASCGSAAAQWSI